MDLSLRSTYIFFCFIIILLILISSQFLHHHLLYHCSTHYNGHLWWRNPHSGAVDDESEALVDGDRWRGRNHNLGRSTARLIRIRMIKTRIAMMVMMIFITTSSLLSWQSLSPSQWNDFGTHWSPGESWSSTFMIIQIVPSSWSSQWWQPEAHCHS